MVAFANPILMNAIRFVIAQSTTRFVVNTVLSAVRYQTLQSSSSTVFTSLHSMQSLLRMVMSQFGGLIADSSYRVIVFRYAEVLFSLALAPVLVAFRADSELSLAYTTALLGVILAIAPPVSKAMTPDAVDHPDELVAVNSWELTSEKILRYLAPVAAAYFLTWFGFNQTLLVSFSLLLILAIVKTTIRFRTLTVTKQHVSTRLIDGASSLLRSDMRLLVANTVITNLVVYPFYSVKLPILLKSQGGEWKEVAALVNAAGAIGPIISQALLQAELLPKSIPVALRVSEKAQILSAIALIACVFFKVNAAVHALCLAFSTAATNTFTVLFNSQAQRVLPGDLRGRFLANLMSVANFAGALGALLYASDDEYVLLSVLTVGACVRLLLLLASNMQTRLMTLL